MPKLPRASTAVAALGSGLAVVAIGIYAADSDLLKVFLPVRTIVAVCGGAGVLALVIRWLAVPPKPTGIAKLMLAATIAITAGFTMWVYQREFLAYREEPISFTSEGTALAGTLYLPRSGAPRAAVVIAQGSLRAPRRAYHVWADAMVRSGIAVLSFDKRGTGQSGGVYEAENNSSTTNLTLLAADVAAAADALASRAEIDRSRIGVVGISMGGWLAPLAAHRTSAIRFIVCISGPAVSVGEEGFFSSLTGEGAASSLAPHRAEIDARVEARVPSGFDPRVAIATLEIPSFWMFGGEDTSVPVTKSIGVLQQLISNHARPIGYRVFAGADHLLVIERWPFRFTPDFRDVLVEECLALPNARPQRPVDGDGGGAVSISG